MTERQIVLKIFARFLKEHGAYAEWKMRTRMHHSKCRFKGDDSRYEKWIHTCEPQFLISAAFGWPSPYEKTKMWSDLSCKWKELCAKKIIYDD